jgi:YwiC-like protein
MPYSSRVAVRLRPLLVPAEHGAWAFVLEPVTLGLLVAPSRAGAFIGLAAFVLFLGRQPLKLGLSDRAAGRVYPRTFVALRIAASAATGATLLGILAWNAGPYRWWPPIAAALPFGALQLAFDIRREGRGLVPEIVGPIAASATAPAIAAAAGWAAPAWLALWALLAARAISATTYVRLRLRLERGEMVNATPAVATHLGAVGLALGLTCYHLAPPLAGVAFAFLLLRAAWGVSSIRRPATARRIGITELFVGAAFVVLVAAGYRQ